MSPYRLAFHALWLAHPVLELAILYFLWKRKLRKEFPVFFWYILAQIAIFCIIYPLYNVGPENFSPNHLMYIWWTTILVSVVLAFRALNEIFCDVMRPYHTLKDLGRVLFRWAALVMILVGVVVAASAQGDSSPLGEAFAVVQRCVRLAQVGMILFLLVFSTYLGVNWRHRSFGLSLGFGAFATAELLIFPLLLSGRGYLSRQAADVLNMVVWNGSLAIWLFYIYRESTLRETGSHLMRSQRWERSLAELQHPVPAESLIPMFESMVERALKRAPGDSAESQDQEEPRSFIERMTSDK